MDVEFNEDMAGLDLSSDSILSPLRSLAAWGVPQAKSILAQVQRSAKRAEEEDATVKDAKKKNAKKIEKMEDEDQHEDEQEEAEEEETKGIPAALQETRRDLVRAPLQSPV
ncbi:Hypothetical Protein FCC1311_025322 [Hondaea fermentalgiana]|uniref:Uncharacterized protein n=1 Tax=Hondaea fermentalgiana TaxID=2315210 RepID=A0A2R5GDN4_9STRA|nr:Hypothetical Protein FCC1311_025322 [Hondaea fermentalgiana]|eukprot:GBG26311.1 Hypothetical Protein FCC1311_025322 [Hondaea fermentalgiana]